MIVYKSEDNGELYLESSMDLDENGEQSGYIKYELQDSFTLTAEQCCGHYGDLVEILIAANVLN